MGKVYEFKEKPLGNHRHWRGSYDSRVLRYWHVPDKDVTLTIDTVTELESSVGRDAKKQLLLRFKGAKLPFAMNATNCTTIEQMYGADPHEWFGKRITLYVTTTEMQGRTMPCIRIRPRAPGPADTKRPEYEPQLNEDVPAPVETEERPRESEGEAHD